MPAEPAIWDAGASTDCRMSWDAYSTNHVAVPGISGSDGQRAHTRQLRWRQRSNEY
jgi:hypothetical protein